jgi:hypothetical protein
MMKFWSNFAKYGSPGDSSNLVTWQSYNSDTNNPNYLILDKKDNLKMSKGSLSFKMLSEELYMDNRVNELEKCVILLQMFTFVGDDIYDENIKDYPGKCNRKEAEDFIIKNASFIEY